MLEHCDNNSEKQFFYRIGLDNDSLDKYAGSRLLILFTNLIPFRASLQNMYAPIPAILELCSYV